MTIQTRDEASQKHLETLLAMPQDEFEAFDFNTKIQDAEDVFFGISTFWFAVLFVYRGQLEPELLNRIIELPDERFQALDFNAGPKHPENRACGVTVLNWAIELAQSNQPALLNRIMELSDERFQALDFNAGAKHAENIACGVTVFYRAIELAQSNQRALLNRIMELPDERFQALDFTAGSKHAENIACGLTVFYKAIELAQRNQPALFNRIMALPDERFQVLDFNVGAKHPESRVCGVTVLNWAIELAQSNQPALLNRIMELSDERFQALDFNAGVKHPENRMCGVTVLYWAVELAQRNQPALLNRILLLPDEQFQALDFNAGPKSKESPKYGQSVLIAACELAQQGDTRILKSLFSLPRDRFKELNLVQTSFASKVLSAITSYAEHEKECVSGLSFLYGLSDEFFSQLNSAATEKERTWVGVVDDSRLLFGSVSENAETEIEKVITKINELEATHLKNSIYVFLAEIIKEKYSHLDAHSLLKAVTPDSPQLYGIACHELAEYYYTAEFDDSDCPEGSSDTASLLQRRLPVLLKAVSFAVNAYMQNKTSEERYRLCLRVAASYWTTTEENISCSGDVTILLDERDETFTLLLKRNEGPIDAIIKWVEAQREIVELRKLIPATASASDNKGKKSAAGHLFSDRKIKKSRLEPNDDCATSLSSASAFNG